MEMCAIRVKFHCHAQDVPAIAQTDMDAVMEILVAENAEVLVNLAWYFLFMLQIMTD